MPAPAPKKSPLEFDTIPHRDSLFIHFDPDSRTYLVQAFFKSDTLTAIRDHITFPSSPVTIDIPQKDFDRARDAFLARLLMPHAPESAVHAG